MRTALVILQMLTFIGLAVLFFSTGDWRLGTAQALLGAVTMVVYL